MLKKGLSVFLSTLLFIFCFFSVPVFAAESDFDIRDYTIEDLQDMTVAEKKELMANYIDTYNPYGIKELMEQAETASNTESLQPGAETQWKSDSDDEEPNQQIATHQMITLEALSVFIGNYGFYEADGTTALVIALNLAAASGLPDMKEIGFFFAGHFYDPDTGKNYLHATLPTAKSKAESHYSDAKTALSKDATPETPYLLGEDFEKAWEQLGMALHYMQDVCEPHHAANQTVANSTHGDFEFYVDLWIDSLMPTVPTIPYAFYEQARQKSAGDLTHTAAVIGKLYVDYTTEEYKSQWDEVGKSCLDNAVWHSARLIYKFFYETNASFMR